ncbi:NAD(P)-dependent oxidoreductase, partial [Salmonella enterica subsp. enterica serovar Poona]
MIAITGATGQLGQHVIENLLKTTPASHLVAIVRNPKKAAPLSQRGIAVRQSDYAKDAALTRALQGGSILVRLSS